MEQKQRMLAAQYRLAQHYLDTLRTAQRTYQQGNENVAYALAMFDREREQVKQWQAWAAKLAGQDDRATALCSAYAEAGPDIFHLRLLPREYLGWLETALEAARQRKDKRAEVVHLLELCATNELTNEHSHTLDYAQQALLMARQIDDTALIARSLNLCANAMRRRGNLEETQQYYLQSLALYQAMGDRRGMAEQFNDLGVLAIHRRNNAAAQEYMEQCLALCQENNDQEGMATCLSNLGFLAIRHGNYLSARSYLEQSLTLFQLMDHKKGIAMVLTNLGIVASYQDDHALARHYFEQGLVITRTTGLREREITCLYQLGKLMMAQGDLPGAERAFKQCFATAGSVEVHMTLAYSLAHLAIISLHRNQEDIANATLRKGWETSNTLPLHSRLIVLIATARLWILKGKPIQAARWLGLIENYADPSVKMTDIQRDLRIAHSECVAATSHEQFVAAWEEGKRLELDAVIAEILKELS